MPVTHYKNAESSFCACACSQPSRRSALTTDDWSLVTCKKCLTHRRPGKTSIDPTHNRTANWVAKKLADESRVIDHPHI